MALSMGVIGSSYKENERRAPLHPDHLGWISQEMRAHLWFERGYGRRFGMEDPRLEAACGGLLSREDVFRRADIVLLPKPMREDFEQMRPGGILWGWVHCVQQGELTQIAIEKKLTIIAWEEMHHWGSRGQRLTHLFQKNNEMAGYTAVLDAMRLTGIDGHYGPLRRAVVFSFGSVSRGAILALQSLGIHHITVLTSRPSILVSNQVPGIAYRHMKGKKTGRLTVIEPDGTSRPIVEVLAEADLIVNGILQDTDHPMMFLHEGEEVRLRPGCLIVDVSCDLGMGFPFARPTSFEDPMFQVGSAFYYAVDHTPSYLWNSATWEISRSLIPFLKTVAEGPDRWERKETIRRAIEIREGIVQNPKILTFQNRQAEYPHQVITADA